MSIDETKVTTFATICLVLLREVRQERGFHQAQVADWLGKTASAWTKIEAGKSPLQFDVFVRVCTSLGLPSSYVMSAAERYASVLSNNWMGDRYAVLTTELDGDDALLRFAQEYWATPGFRLPGNRWGNFQTILNSPYMDGNGGNINAPVFEYAINPAFREQMKNATPIAPSSLPYGGTLSF